jgi:neurotransmitter:Na+ symporter, NSS family
MSNSLEPSNRTYWGTRIGVILAVTGSAVGLGNFLRFPGLAAQYEGGAFMIPYLIGLLVLGLPIAWAEWTMGRYGGSKGFNSPPGIFYAIWRSRLAPYLGALSAVVPVIIYMYYIHLEAWCLAYAWHYLMGHEVLTAGQAMVLPAAEAGAEPTEVRASNFVLWFSGAFGDGEIYASPLTRSLIFVMISFLINFVLIYRGLNKGIEWFSRIAMPALVICAVIILVRVLTLGAPVEGMPERNVLNGLGYMWNLGTSERPLWERLANAQMWVDATGQIFFSLSVGFGLIVTYASYVRPDDDIALSATTSASGNEFCEVALAGMMIVPAAFIFIGPQALAATEGSGLRIGFMALPDVFMLMPWGRFFGFLFFFLLFIAAVTSSLSMLQPTIAMLEEGLGLTRKASVALLGFITATGAAFVGYFSAGLGALDTFDFWIGSFALYVLATIMVLMFGWVLGIERGKEELDRGAEIRIPRFVMYMLKYVCPVYLLAVFILWVYQQAVVPPEEGALSRIQQVMQLGVVQLSLGFIGLVVLLFMLLVAQASRRWRRREMAHVEVSS